MPRCVHKYTEQEEEPAQGSRAKSEHNGDFDFEKGSIPRPLCREAGSSVVLSGSPISFFF